MAVVVNGKRYVTLSDEFFVNGTKVYKAFANGVQVYPDSSLVDHIKITVLPRKLDYSYGEEVDLTGITVVAYDANGNVYSGLPDGIVPVNELTPSPSPVTYDNIFDVPTFGYANVGTSVTTRNYITHDGERRQDSETTVTSQNNTDIYLASGPETPSSSAPAGWAYVNYLYASSEPINRAYEEYAPFTYDGKTVYWWVSGGNTTNPNDTIEATPRTNPGVFPIEFQSNEVRKCAAWLMVYDLDARTKVITVSWPRPGDGLILTDTFTVNTVPTVTSEESGWIDSGGGDF